MRIYLAGLGFPREHSPIPEFERLARLDEVGRHELTDVAATADAVVFTECHLLGADWANRSIRATDEFRRHRDKVYVIDERDRPWCALPGLYASMPRSRLRAGAQLACGYHVIGDPRDRLRPTFDADAEPDLLFSFMGSATHPCREPLFALRHERAVVERVSGFVFADPGQAGFADRRAQFAETLWRSKFGLCPRGHGTSSIRFFETMAAGRVPVIIADEWVPPFGLDVDAFAIRWPEGDVDGLPAELERREGDWTELGRNARRAYETHFGESVLFDRTMDAIAALASTDPWRDFPRFGYPDRALLQRATKQALVRVRDTVRAHTG